MLTPRKTKSLPIGATIEQHALQWLTDKGLCLITQNYRCKTGEIDIIMKNAEQLVFVEVRYRSSVGFGSALESVDKRKQKKLLRTAAVFLANNPKHANRPCRFDVLAVQLANDHNQLHWTWVKGAFTA